MTTEQLQSIRDAYAVKKAELEAAKVALSDVQRHRYTLETELEVLTNDLNIAIEEWRNEEPCAEATPPTPMTSQELGRRAVLI